MAEISNQALIKKAASVINPKKVKDVLIGDVGCALVSEKNKVHLGVCIGTGSSMGLCAEHSAIAAMVTAGEYQIKKLVAVWKDDKGVTHVLPPCGNCREFMRQVDEGNLQTDIVLGENKVAKLAELLPYHDWLS